MERVTLYVDGDNGRGMDFSVPKDWLAEIIEKKYKIALDEFMDEWTYCETDNILFWAENCGVATYTDERLEKLWQEFGDVLIDYDNPDCPDGIIEHDWLVFETGTERMEIWRWFDEHYSGGVYKLMFPSKH